jgi:hypothetical protein
MPGILDTFIQQSILRRLMENNQGPATSMAVQQGANAPTAGMRLTPAPAASQPFLRSMTPEQEERARILTGVQPGPSAPTAGASYDMPDVAQEIALANQGPMPSMPDPYASSPGGQQAALDVAMRAEAEAAAQEDPTFLKFLEAAGRGLSIAGSQDPIKAFTTFNQLDKEARDSSKPKVTPLQGGAFSMITRPGGRTEIVRNDQIADFIEETSGNKFLQKLMLADQSARNQLNVAGGKADIAAAEAAKPILADVQGLKERWTDALGIVSTQGTGAKIQGAFPGIAGFFGTDEAAKNKFLQGLTVSETLLNTALTKGAISNAEMNLFKSPIPSLTDDREKVWKPWIEKRLEVLAKMEARLGAEAMRGQVGNVPPAPAPATTGGSTPVPNSVLPKAGKYF